MSRPLAAVRASIASDGSSNIVDPNGEMSEWLKEHAWKTTPPTLTE